MVPEHSKWDEEGNLVINHKMYERKIQGLRKIFWSVVFEIGDYEQVARMDTETLLEARAAQQVFADEMKDNMEGGGG